MELLGFGNVAFAKKDEIRKAVIAHAQSGNYEAIANAIKASAELANEKSAKGKRATMIAFMPQLPEDIRLGLMGAEGYPRLRMTDAKQLYFTRPCGGNTTIHVIKNDEVKAPGKTNVSNAKLDKDKPFLVTGIQLLSGTSEAGAENAYKVNFGVCHPVLLNGEFRIDVNEQPICDEASCQVFGTGDVFGTLPGYYHLDNPILLLGDKPFKYTLNTPAALPADTWVRVVFHGIAIVPAGA